jgi:murein DD-endopeptidase MepM/ murein hydrolase activator NlpD
VVGRRGTLAGTLDRLGASPELRQALLETIGVQLNLRRLSPRTGIVVTEDGDSRWLGVTLRPEAARVLEVDLTGENDKAAARWIDLPVETEVRTASAEVRQSVAQALAGLDDGNHLTLAFADIFQWDVDLLVDPRPGDRVAIVYEVNHLGAVSTALPEFGDAPRTAGEVLGPGRILAASYRGRIASGEAFWLDDADGTGDYYDADGRTLRKTFLKSPLNYRRISSRFSRARRNPVTRRVVPHHGVDYAADTGTPVVASADGRVAAAGWDGPLGKAVRIRHGSEYETIYGHLRSFAKGIRRGVQVRQNQVIGYVGATGRATGPHLHYTVRHRGRPIDPLRIENPPVEPLSPSRLPALAAVVERWEPMLGGETLQVRRDEAPPRHPAR